MSNIENKVICNIKIRDSYPEICSTHTSNSKCALVRVLTCAMYVHRRWQERKYPKDPSCFPESYCLLMCLTSGLEIMINIQPG